MHRAFFYLRSHNEIWKVANEKEHDYVVQQDARDSYAITQHLYPVYVHSGLCLFHDLFDVIHRKHRVWANVYVIITLCHSWVFGIGWWITVASITGFRLLKHIIIQLWFVIIAKLNFLMNNGRISIVSRQSGGLVRHFIQFSPSSSVCSWHNSITPAGSIACIFIGGRRSCLKPCSRYRHDTVKK